MCVCLQKEGKEKKEVLLAQLAEHPLNKLARGRGIDTPSLHIDIGGLAQMVERLLSISCFCCFFFVGLIRVQYSLVALCFPRSIVG